MYEDDTQEGRGARPWKVYGLVLLLGSPSVSYVLAATPTGPMPPLKVLALKATKSLQPYASSSITYDDNLFRASDATGEEQGSGPPLESDIEYSALAGLKIDWPFSQQRLTADHSVNHHHFERFDFLDYTGADVRTALKWAFGRNWGGGSGLPLRSFTCEFYGVKARWKLTGKSSLLVSAWHELTDINQEIVNFAVSDGMSIEPTWSLTRKHYG